MAIGPILRICAVALLSTMMLACSNEEKEHEPSAVEEAGKELGQAVSRDLHEEIDAAKSVEQQTQQAAEQLDKQVDEQTGGNASEP